MAHFRPACAQYSILLVIVRERVAFFVRRAKNEQAAKAVIYIKVNNIRTAASAAAAPTVESKNKYHTHCRHQQYNELLTTSSSRSSSISYIS